MTDLLMPIFSLPVCSGFGHGFIEITEEDASGRPLPSFPEHVRPFVATVVVGVEVGYYPSASRLVCSSAVEGWIPKLKMARLLQANLKWLFIGHNQPGPPINTVNDLARFWRGDNDEEMVWRLEQAFVTDGAGLRRIVEEAKAQPPLMADIEELCRHLDSVERTQLRRELE